MNIILLFFFALAPSIVWLLYYLKKDVTPEPRRMILLAFVAGAVMILPALLIEYLSFTALNALAVSSALTAIIAIFVSVALTEEVLKYLGVRFTIFRTKAADESIDVILYLIVAALGFAALENILILFRLGPNAFWEQYAIVSMFRLVGATLLHALASALVGYFLLLSMQPKQKTSKRRVLLWSGIGLAALLHGTFNWFIIQNEGVLRFFIPALVILGLALFLKYTLGRTTQLTVPK